MWCRSSSLRGDSLWLCSSVRERRAGRRLSSSSAAFVSNEISSRSIEREHLLRLLAGHINFDNSRRAVIPDSLQSNNDEGSAVLSKEAIREGPFK